MKQLLLALTLLFLPAVLFADEATHTYLVATRHPVGGPKGYRLPIMQTDQFSDYARSTERDFEHVNGFSAELTASEAAALSTAPDVRYVEPAVERHILGIGTNATPRNLNGQTMPYGINLVDAPAAWTATRGANINVAIIDTGIDYNHPDLKNQFAGGFNEITRTTDPLDDNGHGTHVAGIIAAEDNNIGVVGVAPSTRIWSVKVLGSNGSGTTANVVAGVDWVIAKKAAVGGNWIISESLGSSDPSQLEQDATTQAINAGIIVVAASGNDSTATLAAPVSYPAAYPGVLAIGAIDSTSTIADFSNQGPELAFVAPGVDVLSTLPVGTGAIGEVTTDGGSTLNAPPLTGSARGTITSHFVYCNLGNPEDFPAGVKGKIALIKRGTLTFHDKVKNALAAGAIGVIIFNKDTSSLNWTLISQTCDANGNNCKDNPADLTFAWPVTVGMSLDDGTALMNNPNATVTIIDQKDDYGVLSGTSMATPHASGVVALVWGVAPTATASQVITALTTTAHDLGAAGRDNAYGNGLLDAAEAAKLLNPGAFGGGASPIPHPSTGRPFLKRGH